MRYSIYISIFILLLAACDNKDELTFDPEYKYLWGTWEEDFRWSDIYYSYNIGQGESRIGKLKTSTIEFYGNNFRVKILPPERKIISAPDTLYITYSSDTLFSGNFSITEDTLKFFISGQSQPVKFRYSISNDSLSIESFSDTLENNNEVVKYFLWGNSINKRSGVFINKF